MLYYDLSVVSIPLLLDLILVKFHDYPVPLHATVAVQLPYDVTRFLYELSAHYNLYESLFVTLLIFFMLWR